WFDSEFDQILFTVIDSGEVIVIDHQIDMETTRFHEGGRYDKGGDILYRWGNPDAYNHGSPGNQVLFGPNSVSVIPHGYPGGGHVLVLNNGLHRKESLYNLDHLRFSTVHEFKLPRSDTGAFRDLKMGRIDIYEPTVFDQEWIFEAIPRTKVYSAVMGSAQRLPNGNTLIMVSLPHSAMFEITMAGQLVWEWDAYSAYSWAQNVSHASGEDSDPDQPEYYTEDAPLPFAFQVHRTPIDFVGIKALDAECLHEIGEANKVYMPE
ncbi:hypothetical protein CYMTET_31503, partial [Cymbomonas tetramitiformis]